MLPEWGRSQLSVALEEEVCKCRAEECSCRKMNTDEFRVTGCHAPSTPWKRLLGGV